MKTLFLVWAGFFSMLTLGHAADEIPWHAVKPGDFAGPVATGTSLEKLEKMIKVRVSMAAIVATCGLPSAQIDPARWPLPRTTIVMSGGIIWHDGVLIGEERYKRYRYDFPTEGQVIITANEFQSVEYAILETSEGNFSEYLVGQPNVLRLEAHPNDPPIPHISKDTIK